MGIFTSLKNLFKQSSVQKTALNYVHSDAEGVNIPDQIISRLADSYDNAHDVDLTYSDYSVAHDVLARLYAINPFIAGVIDMKANAIASTVVRVKRNKDFSYLSPLEQDSLLEGRETELYNLFVKQNSTQHTITKLLLDINVSLDVFGIFILMNDIDVNGNNVMVCLNPLFCEIIPAADGKKIDGVKYKVAHEDLFIGESRLLIGTNPNFSNAKSGYYFGQSKLRSVVSTGEGLIYANVADAYRFQRGDQIPLVLKVAQNIGQDGIKLLQKSIKNRKTKDSQTILLPEEVEVVPSLTYTYQRSSSSDFKQDSLKQYCVALGVPFRLVQPDSTVDYEALTAFWWETSLLARKAYLEELFTAKFCVQYANKRVDYKIVLDHSHLGWYVSKMLNMTRIAVAQVSSGIITPNEARISMFGLPKHASTYDDFGNTPKPVYDQKINEAASSTGTSSSTPPVNLPGSVGGRDQSANGEVEFIDETGRR